MKRILLASLLIASPVQAQQVYTIHLTSQQIDGIIEAGAACLEKQPYACAEYTIYIRNLLTAAKKPEANKKEE